MPPRSAYRLNRIRKKFINTECIITRRLVVFHGKPKLANNQLKAFENNFIPYNFETTASMSENKLQKSTVKSLLAGDFFFCNSKFTVHVKKKQTKRTKRQTQISTFTSTPTWHHTLHLSSANTATTHTRLGTLYVGVSFVSRPNNRPTQRRIIGRAATREEFQ